MCTGSPLAVARVDWTAGVTQQHFLNCSRLQWHLRSRSIKLETIQNFKAPLHEVEWQYRLLSITGHSTGMTGGLARSTGYTVRPAPHCRTPILSYSLRVTPAEHLLNWQLDAAPQSSGAGLFPDKTNEFTVEVDLVAELSPVNPFDFFLDPGSKTSPSQYAPELAKDLEPYLAVDPAEPAAAAVRFSRVLRREARNDRLSDRLESTGA